MSDLLTRLEAHRAAGHASPGFHLSDEDMDEIIRGLRAVRPEPSAPRQHHHATARLFTGMEK